MVGQTLSHYQIQDKLGQGGMGVVYKAWDLHLKRFTAVKILPPDRVNDPERRRRFIQEARAASGLNHPNIVSVYDVDRADGTDFIAMEYVAGKPLDQMIGKRGLPLKEALHYAIQIADALGHAHAAGIVHRDLKPANVVVTPAGIVKVLDFGLAKLTERSGDEAAQVVTMSAGDSPDSELGGIIGTLAYMSPEQAEGKQVDSRSDIFSFGSVLYEMVTGSRPFKSDSAASTLVALLSREPDAPRQLVKALPPDLEKIILRCLRKDPSRRFHSIFDVKVELEELTSAAHGQPPAADIPKRRQASRMLLASGSVVLPLLAVIGWILLQDRSVPVPSPTTAPLTSYPGIEWDPSFSPDGNQVAFAWAGDKPDNFDIYVKLVGPGTPLRLTTHPASEGLPAWSPDGTQIAFLRYDGAGVNVLVISPLGGPERTLVRMPNGLPGLSWSPDGKYLAVAEATSSDRVGGVFLLRAETGEMHRLTALPDKSWYDFLPTLSPDGRKMAFVRVRAHLTGDLYVLDLTGVNPHGEPRQVTFDGRDVRGLDWSTDGRSIVFSSNREIGQRLWRVPIGGGAIERLQVGTENAFELSIARRQTRLAYAQNVSDSNIWRIPGPSASPSISRVPQKLIASTRADSNPQYSPDGKNVAFTSRRSGPQEIWVSDAEGSNPRQLTNFGGPSVGSPRWSPDGNRIAFDSTKEGNNDIYIVGAEGGLSRRVTSEPSEEARPSWSRDGRWIYFGSNRGGDWQVWRTPVDGGASVQITKRGGYEAYESFDRFVYYCMRESPGIWRVEPDGGQEVQVNPQGVLGGWIPTRQGIAFFVHDAAKPRIELFDVTMRRSTRLVEFSETTRILLGPSRISVSPDGRWILYGQADPSEGDIMLVENFK